MSMKLSDDQHCYVCGVQNDSGLRLNFEITPEKELRSEVMFLKKHQGYQDIVHGGFLMMVLDEMVVNLAWKLGTPCVTAEITTRLKIPAKINQSYRLYGYLDEERGRLIKGHSEIQDADGRIVAQAWVSCLKISLNS